MSNQFLIEQLKYAVGIGGLFSFYGVVSFVVWFMGDKMNYPVQSRVVIIALLLITLPIALIIGFVVSRRSKKKKAAEKAAQEAGATDKPEAESANFAIIFSITLPRFASVSSTILMSNCSIANIWLRIFKASNC